MVVHPSSQRNVSVFIQPDTSHVLEFTCSTSGQCETSPCLLPWSSQLRTQNLHSGRISPTPQTSGRIWMGWGWLLVCDCVSCGGAITAWKLWQHLILAADSVERDRTHGRHLPWHFVCQNLPLLKHYQSHQPVTLCRRQNLGKHSNYVSAECYNLYMTWMPTINKPGTPRSSAAPLSSACGGKQGRVPWGPEAVLIGGWRPASVAPEWSPLWQRTERREKRDPAGCIISSFITVITWRLVAGVNIVGRCVSLCVLLFVCGQQTCCYCIRRQLMQCLNPYLGFSRRHLYHTGFTELQNRVKLDLILWLLAALHHLTSKFVHLKLLWNGWQVTTRGTDAGLRDKKVHTTAYSVICPTVSTQQLLHRDYCTWLGRLHSNTPWNHLQPKNMWHKVHHSCSLLFMFDSQPLSSVHVERPCALAVAVALGAVLLPVAGLAVDLLVVNSQRGAV